MMDRELWSILFSMFRFLVGLVLSIVGFILMSVCVWSLFMGTNISSVSVDVVHIGVAGLCIHTVGEGILDSLMKSIDEELEG